MESQKDNGRNVVSTAGNYSSQMPELRASKSIVQKLSARVNAKGKMKKIGESVIQIVWNINISKPASGTKTILITVAKEEIEILNF
jgi:hypothetical protein